ncbi:MAG: hypothetical protein E6Q75_04385 [Rheinheimera sp.]|nr:MAG: hypothetical protein E6Q75_04385 [Rheinheimera sp.]
MNTEYLYDSNWTLYAAIDKMPNGDQIIRSMSGGIIGRYYASSNVTIEILTGRVVARGNALTMLLTPNDFRR